MPDDLDLFDHHDDEAAADHHHQVDHHHELDNVDDLRTSGGRRRWGGLRHDRRLRRIDHQHDQAHLTVTTLRQRGQGPDSARPPLRVPFCASRGISDPAGALVTTKEAPCP